MILFLMIWRALARVPGNFADFLVQRFEPLVQLQVHPAIQRIIKRVRLRIRVEHTPDACHFTHGSVKVGMEFQADGGIDRRAQP